MLERQLESLFGHTADLMCELDHEFRIVRANPRLAEFVGPSRPSSGTTFEEIFDQLDRGEVRRVLGEFAASRDSVTIESRVSCEHGSSWTSWQVTRIDEDRFIGVGRDISKHREAERQLVAKSSFLHSIIEAEPECVKLVDRNGELLDMNEAGLRMVGAADRSEAIGQNVYDLMAPEFRDKFSRFNEKVCGGEGGDLSFDIIGLDGTRRSMETTAVPLPRELEGDVIHLAITRDVTQRLQLEEQLRHAQRMDAVGQLAGGIAHDFNNLLTAIIGPCELILSEVNPTEPFVPDLLQIRSTSERAARLTQQLLAFARRQVVQPSALSLVELVATMEDMLRRIIGEEFALEFELDHGCSPVVADRGQIEQVLLNLVINARHAIHVGGQINIRVADDIVTEDRASSIGCQPGIYVSMSVEDNGDGIEPDALPQVFDPFFTTKPPGQGAGLGLATCYGIVTQAGGAITVESQLGEHTVFTVLLPVADMSVPGSRESEAPDLNPFDPNREQGGVVLVVEDEKIVRSTVARMLKSLGYTVYQASDGESALELMSDIEDPSLVITDMKMPGMGGLALARTLSRDYPDLRVLFMTGYSRDLMEDADVLLKPFSSSTLSKAVLRAMDAPPRRFAAG